jgi:hypothetical protein
VVAIKPHAYNAGMSKFLPIGNRWINLENVTEIHSEETVSGNPLFKVWFTSGAAREVKDDEAKQLLEWLRKNEAK